MSIDFSSLSIGYAGLKSDFMLIYEHFRRLAYLSKNESEIIREVLSKQANESEKIISDHKKMEKELKFLATEIEIVVIFKINKENISNSYFISFKEQKCLQ